MLPAVKNRIKISSASLILFIFLFLVFSYSCFAADKPAQLIRVRTFSLRTIPAERAILILKQLGLGDTVVHIPKTNAISVTADSIELSKAQTIVELVDSNQPYVVERVDVNELSQQLTAAEIISKLPAEIKAGTLKSAPAKGPSASIIESDKGDIIIIAPKAYLQTIRTTIENAVSEVLTKTEEDKSSKADETKASIQQDVNLPAEEQPINETLGPNAVVELNLDPNTDISIVKEPVKVAVRTENVQDQMFDEMVKQLESARAKTEPGQSETEEAILPDGNEPAEANAVQPAALQEPPAAAEVNEAIALGGDSNQAESQPQEQAPLDDFEKRVLDQLAKQQPQDEEPAGQADELKDRSLTLAARKESPEQVWGLKDTEQEAADDTQAGETADEQFRQSNVSVFDELDIPNADQMFTLNMQEKVSIVSLIELVGKCLGLDYLYDEQKVKGEVTLKVQGPMSVRQLYQTLESVLRFQGLVMSRKGKLVTIRPAAEAIDADATFADTGIKAGDVIVTNVLHLQYIDTATAARLLTEMKLGAAINQIPESRVIIVTEFAYRMARIEKLLAMIDVPGPPKQFKMRIMKYTMAEILVPKVKALAEQLGTVQVSMGADVSQAGMYGTAAYSRTRPTRIASPAQPQQPGQPAAAAHPTQARGEAAASTVYIDYDQRTNRILMIGVESDIELIDELIDSLDVPQKDLREIREYEITYIGAEDVKNYLSELGIITAASTTSRGGYYGTRTFRGETVGQEGMPPGAVQQQQQMLAQQAGQQFTSEGGLVGEPQVVLLESTNSLLVNATPEQHENIARIISYVDREAVETAIPFRIYKLENTTPEKITEILNNLIEKTIKDEQGKVQKRITREEEIAIVPDENTFSVIVYASKKNQEWIAELIKTLDKRRPQVLIDVILAEVSRTDDFDFDLQLATKLPEMVAGGKMDVVPSVGSTTFLEGTRHEYSTISGTAKGFYSDRHIQALLTAMQTKSYGRILAKPKILVNDGEEGTISTTDTTNVQISEIIVPDQGSPQTTTKFEPVSAGITLTITPNISEGDLLLLQIDLSRSGFTTQGSITQPPDTSENKVTTVVTVPNEKTIILGGLLQLNQSKGGSKVPVLGDIPLVGGAFRTTKNRDKESKLYIFVKANILRPDDTLKGLSGLEHISNRSREAFEEFEDKLHRYEDWPGIKPKPMEPERVLEQE